MYLPLNIIFNLKSAGLLLLLLVVVISKRLLKLIDAQFILINNLAYKSKTKTLTTTKNNKYTN